ncbi:hypothetical protein, partial [Enterococcus lactis]|uniref:hypothetical protein n=1 Tax=Enterococcus lactis TaxID=357441 RepID=UPI001BD0DEA5
ADFFYHYFFLQRMISKNHSLLLSFEIEETVCSGKIVPSTSNYVIFFFFFLAERYFDEKKGL